MDRAAARLNVERYRRLLAEETDEARRQTILQLLAAEEAKLAEAGPRGKSARRASADPPIRANGSGARPAAPWFPP